MPKEQTTTHDATVLEVLPQSRFRLRLHDQHVILAYLANQARRGRRPMVGDAVQVEMTPYDPDRGRIIGCGAPA